MNYLHLPDPKEVISKDLGNTTTFLRTLLNDFPKAIMQHFLERHEKK